MPCSNGEESGSEALRTRDAADVALVLLNPPILLLVMWAAKRMTGLSYAYLIYHMYPDFPVALDIIEGPSPRPGMGTGHANGVPRRRPHRDPRGRGEATAGVHDGAGFCVFHQKGREDSKLGGWTVYRPTAHMRKPVRPGGGAHGFLCASLFRQHRPQHVQTVLPCIGFPARSFSVTRLWTCGISSSRSSRIALNAFSTSRAP